jgi:hypothetical protein
MEYVYILRVVNAIVGVYKHKEGAENDAKEMHLTCYRIDRWAVSVRL